MGCAFRYGEENLKFVPVERDDIRYARALSCLFFLSNPDHASILLCERRGRGGGARAQMGASPAVGGRAAALARVRLRRRPRHLRRVDCCRQCRPRATTSAGGRAGLFRRRRGRSPWWWLGRRPASARPRAGRRWTMSTTWTRTRPTTCRMSPRTGTRMRTPTRTPERGRVDGRGRRPCARQPCGRRRRSGGPCAASRPRLTARSVQLPAPNGPHARSMSLPSDLSVARDMRDRPLCSRASLLTCSYVGRGRVAPSARARPRLHHRRGP